MASADDAQSLTRRELMLALSVTATGLPKWIEDLLFVAIQPPAVASSVPVSHRVTAAERAILRAFCDRILPRTDTPGALDAKAPEFIEYCVAQVDDRSTQEIHDALADLDAGCVATCKLGMAHATPVDVDRFLQTIEDRVAVYTDGLRIAWRPDWTNFIAPWLKLEQAPAEERKRIEFYLFLKWLTISAWSTSEVGTQALHAGHSPFHGDYQGCSHPEHLGG